MQSFIKRLCRKTARKFNKCLDKDATNKRSVMHAATNQLPPVQFHHVHGANIRLSSNKLVARRVDSFCQGLVFSNRIILPNERVYIKLIKVAERQNGVPQWSGTIRFGFTSIDPATLTYKIPKYACPDMTSAGTTWAKALSDKVVHENIVIHFSYDTSGRIHYGINNQDCGIFQANVTTTKHLWFILDIYGNTTGVELIDPRIHSSTNASALSPRSNMKLPDDYAPPEATLSPAARRRRSLHNNSLNQQTALTMAYSTGPQHLMTLAALNRPIANQNIYSPSPMMNANVIQAPPHHHPSQHYRQPRLARANMHRYLQSSNQQYHHHHHQQQQQAIRGASSNCRSASYNHGAQPEEQQLEQAFRGLSTTTTTTNEPSTSTKSKGTSVRSVVAQQRQSQSNGNKAAAKSSLNTNNIKFDKNSSTTNTRRHQRHQSQSSNSSASSSSTSLHTKSEQSSTKKKANTPPDAPATRDCPICYERPINCVLYQCGHMCTCYECGVKQWRTQSRTCPICRTVIKDVIKTFMS